MANETFTANQSIVFALDADGDGVIDPGEIVTTTVTITNNSTNPTAVAATGVQFTEDLQGMTLVNQAGDDINASPIAFDDSYTAAGNVPFTGVGMLNNDAEPLGPEGLALNTGTAIQNTGVAFATTQGGSVTLNANGTFTYISAVGFEGVDTFTYTLRDTGLDAVAGNADDLSGTGTVSITVGPSVWFIDNTAAPGGNGTQATPFNSIAAFNAAQGTANGPDAGDFVYLRHGTGTYSEADGINLATGQTLIGQGQNLVVNGVTIEVGSAGLTPTIQVTDAGGEGVLLAQNNTLSGFNISTTNAAADGIEDGGGTVGTLTISSVSISGTGQAVDIDQGGTLNVTLASVTSTGSSEEGIQLAGVAGSFTASTVSLNGMTGDGIDLDNNSATVAINGGSIGNSNDPGGIGVDVNAGSASVTIAASVTKTTAGDIVEVTGRTTGTVTLSGNLSATGAVSNGIDVNSNTGGTINFTGATQTLTTGANTAINLATNTGATINFNPAGGGNGLDISTTSGTGFNATGGGTVTVQGAGNTITSTTGTALNIANTTIGANDVTFQSISATGASANAGIVLNTTGSLGGLTVTGTDGADADSIPDAGTGGTISGRTVNQVQLTSTKDVSLGGMTITGGTHEGITGTNVNGITLPGTLSTNHGTTAPDEGINPSDTRGATTIPGVTATGNRNSNVHITTTQPSTAAITTLTVTGGSFSNPVENAGLLVDLHGSA